MAQKSYKNSEMPDATGLIVYLMQKLKTSQLSQPKILSQPKGSSAIKSYMFSPTAFIENFKQTLLHQMMLIRPLWLVDIWIVRNVMEKDISCIKYTVSSGWNPRT